MLEIKTSTLFSKTNREKYIEEIRGTFALAGLNSRLLNFYIVNDCGIYGEWAEGRELTITCTDEGNIVQLKYGIEALNTEFVYCPHDIGARFVGCNIENFIVPWIPKPEQFGDRFNFLAHIIGITTNIKNKYIPLCGWLYLLVDDLIAKEVHLYNLEQSKWVVNQLQLAGLLSSSKVYFNKKAASFFGEIIGNKLRRTTEYSYDSEKLVEEMPAMSLYLWHRNTKKKLKEFGIDYTFEDKLDEELLTRWS